MNEHLGTIYPETVLAQFEVDRVAGSYTLVLICRRCDEDLCGYEADENPTLADLARFAAQHECG